MKHCANKRFSIHNHEPNLHSVAYPAHRVLSMEEKSTLVSFINASIAPKEIRTYMR